MATNPVPPTHPSQSFTANTIATYESRTSPHNTTPYVVNANMAIRRLPPMSLGGW
ncbi:hypothetical protein HanIR_Chr01g0026911 [Helianthus annuus]|nr:hypothetical protein HanIR_Chr01g0026911 [Helianthus annuus]